jgi:hypothetical protein
MLVVIDRAAHPLRVVDGLGYAHDIVPVHARGHDHEGDHVHDHGHVHAHGR